MRIDINGKKKVNVEYAIPGEKNPGILLKPL